MRNSILHDGRARVAMLWVVIVAVGAARADQFYNSSAPRSSPAGWLESLRRQLMADNYDYLAASDDDAAGEDQETALSTTADFVPRAHDDATEPSSGNQSYSSPKYSPPQYAPVEMDGAGRGGEGGEGGVVSISRNDLEYYMDDARLAAPAHERLAGGRRAEPPLGATHQLSELVHNLSSESVEQPQNVSYKLIQVAGPSRRGGAGPRFVEERGADGVAIVSVDGAPFPQFRLPAPRRQYAPADANSYELD